MRTEQHRPTFMALAQKHQFTRVDALFYLSALQEKNAEAITSFRRSASPPLLLLDLVKASDMTIARECAEDEELKAFASTRLSIPRMIWIALHVNACGTCASRFLQPNGILASVKQAANAATASALADTYKKLGIDPDAPGALSLADNKTFTPRNRILSAQTGMVPASQANRARTGVEPSVFANGVSGFVGIFWRPIEQFFKEPWSSLHAVFMKFANAPTQPHRLACAINDLRPHVRNGIAAATILATIGIPLLLIPRMRGPDTTVSIGQTCEGMIVPSRGLRDALKVEAVVQNLSVAVRQTISASWIAPQVTMSAGASSAVKSATGVEMIASASISKPVAMQSLTSIQKPPPITPTTMPRSENGQVKLMLLEPMTPVWISERAHVRPRYELMLFEQVVIQGGSR